MGYQYVNVIANILKANNPNLTNEEALSLSRIGLHDTSYWNLNISSNDRINAIHANDVGRGTISDSTSKQIGC